MRRLLPAVCLALLLVPPSGAIPAGASPAARKPGAAAPAGKLVSGTFSGLAFRSIGPAFTSGRIIDVAIDPTDFHVWYVAAASGGVWKTVNGGTTWTPIFDDQGSYSIGCVTVDPKRPLTVWVGSGENNSQRSVSYGDGLYKSVDGGRSWKKVGLENSEHIGKILVDPTDSDVVYVAAQGPLWSPGGDRGLYKTTDGGATWTRVLTPANAWTGVSDIAMDPRDHRVLYATTYQRARRMWTLVDGGPGGGIQKSTDGGKTWTALKAGLPEGDLGRIGICLSPQNPDVVYALVEARGKDGGFYRSTDGGSHWEKRGSYNSTSPQYYQEIIPDPKVEGRIYSMDTWMQVTDDAGKTWRHVGEKYKHVDNHALWIEPDNSDHLIAGCDGGLYESFDRGATWRFFSNLPVTQFYKVEADNSSPYIVYGGTQDNFSLGVPSRTRTEHGIVNSDAFVTTGGDGFQTRVDPEDPNLVYSESQYGGLVRHDRRTGETVDLQPQPGPDDPPLRWNWDSPLIVSPHSHTRLYFAAQRLFRSDDRGDTWVPVSGDLTRQLDRNKMKVMDRVWSLDAIAKNASTSFYGNITALTESPRKENVIAVGTDDGLVQVTEDGGKSWRRVDRFPGVPELTYVSHLEFSRHHDGTLYATFDNHTSGDFKPYVLKSTDYGRSWTEIAGDLPARGSAYSICEDTKQPDLLFVGTEFGVFFTADGGKKWTQLKGGLPVICVRDLAIQRRDDDLVLATFGRGFYVLDDLSPLRHVADGVLDSTAALMPVRGAEAYVPASPLGGREKSFQGDAFFAAPNPPFGATFTYYLDKSIETQEKKRLEKEKELEKSGADVFYPPWDSVRAEAREEEPTAILTVSDAEGNVVRRVTGPVSAGFHRVAWDLRYPSSEPVRLAGGELAPWDQPPVGPLVAPGTYAVTLSTRVRGVVRQVAGPASFTVTPLGTNTLPPKDRAALLAFEEQTARLQRAVLGASRVAHEALDHLALLKKAIDDTPGASTNALATRARALENRLKDVLVSIDGDRVVASHDEPVSPSITDRVTRVVQGHWYNTGDPTNTLRREYDIAADQFGTVLPTLRTLVDEDLRALERDAEGAGAPWTPGRVPDWKK